MSWSEATRVCPTCFRRESLPRSRPIPMLPLRRTSASGGRSGGRADRHVRAARLDEVGALVDPDALRPVLGPLVDITCEPMPTAGFSGSQHFLLLAKCAD